MSVAESPSSGMDIGFEQETNDEGACLNSFNFNSVVSKLNVHVYLLMT